MRTTPHVVLASVTALAIGLAGVGPAHGGDRVQVLYGIGSGIGDGSSNLYRIDMYTGAPVAVDVGETDAQCFDLAINREGTVGYTIAGGQLREINLSNGASQPVGPTGIGTMTALEFLDDDTLLAWGQVDPMLYSIDLDTGAATALFSLGLSPGGDLAVNANGVVYGSTGAALVEIDLDKEAVTPIGPFGVNSILGLDMDTNGDLYGVRGSIANGLATLYRIDINTGAADLIGDIADVTDFGCFGASFLHMPLLGDIEEDGDVDPVDLALILSMWGPCPPPGEAPCPADLTGDGVVNILDIIEFLANWG